MTSNQESELNEFRSFPPSVQLHKTTTKAQPFFKNGTQGKKDDPGGRCSGSSRKLLVLWSPYLLSTHPGPNNLSLISPVPLGWGREWALPSVGLSDRKTRPQCCHGGANPPLPSPHLHPLSAASLCPHLFHVPHQTSWVSAERRHCDLLVSTPLGPPHPLSSTHTHTHYLPLLALATSLFPSPLPPSPPSILFPSVLSCCMAPGGKKG